MPNIKTICVGNIYLVGTEDPLTIKLYEILKKLDNRVATVKKYYSDQKDEQLLLKKKTTLIISNSRKNAVQEGLNQNYKFLIFDDGLQETKIDYDMKFVCFKLKNWIGNGQLIPAGPLREKISSLKNLMLFFLNGNFKNFRKIKDIILSIILILEFLKLFIR